MNRVVVVTVAIVALIGFGGCSQGPNSRAALIERVKVLEEKNARLEDDLRAMAGSRDSARQLLAKAEEYIQKLQVVVNFFEDLNARVGK